MNMFLLTVQLQYIKYSRLLFLCFVLSGFDLASLMNCDLDYYIT